MRKGEDLSVYQLGKAGYTSPRLLDLGDLFERVILNRRVVDMFGDLPH